MKRQKNNPYDKLEIITDVFGEHFYVKDVLYDKKFKIEVYTGRPVDNTRGRDRFIVTPALKAFILSTLDVPIKEFTGLLKISKMMSFRRLVQDNPFKSYEHWVTSKRKDKPHYITFNDARENPQILTDVLGHRYVLLSATRTKEGLVLPMGALEERFFNTNIYNSKKTIVTPEIAKILEKTRSSLSEGEKYLPLMPDGVSRLHTRIGHRVSDLHNERNAVYVRHINELINSTASEFFLNHPELEASKETVGDIKVHIALLLREAKKPKSLLISTLIEHWNNPNTQTIKKVDKAFGRKSSKVRRAFLILKKAKKI